MTISATSDTSFWHPLTDQQTSTTVGLGFVTTNLSDPSVSYWPGPGLLPPFSVGREWITHYTSAKFSASAMDSVTRFGSVSMSEFGNQVQGSAAHDEQGNRKFLSEILITYKLKNPAQFLRDVFRASHLTEFVSRFDESAAFYVITGYKVSRNAQTAFDQQDDTKNSIKFELSCKLRLMPDFSTPIGVGSGGSNEHKVLSTIDFKAPGDSIFFVRYQKLEFSRIFPGVMTLPASPLTWSQWFECLGRTPVTVILPEGDGATQRLIVTRESVYSAVKRLESRKRMQIVGRRATHASGQDETAYDADLAASTPISEMTPLLPSTQREWPSAS